MHCVLSPLRSAFHEVLHGNPTLSSSDWFERLKRFPEAFRHHARNSFPFGRWPPAADQLLGTDQVHGTGIEHGPDFFPLSGRWPPAADQLLAVDQMRGAGIEHGPEFFPPFRTLATCSRSADRRRPGARRRHRARPGILPPFPDAGHLQQIS